MIKVLYIVSTLKRSGPNNQLYSLIKNLDEELVDPVILTLSPEVNDSLVNDFSNLQKVRLLSLKMTRLKGFFSARSGIQKILEREKPDVIQTQGIRSDSLIAYFFSMNSHIIRIANYPYDDYVMRYGKFKGRLMASFHINVLKRAKSCIAVSEALCEKLKKHRVFAKTISNGVDSNKFKTISPARKIELRNKLKLPQNSIIIVSVGHLSPLKDPLTIIKSINRMSNNPLPFLLVLGSGELMRTCKMEARKGGDRIVFKGRVSDVIPYLQAADIFASASLTEGLPNTVLEAASCGLPLCLSDIPQHKEIISRNVMAGVTFKKQNESDLMEKLNQLCDESPKKLQERRIAAENLISKYYDAKIMSEKYYNHYLELTEKS